MAKWKTLSTRVAYENPFMLVHEDQAINPAGKQTVYGYVESKSDSVYVIPIDEEGSTYIIRQYRYPIKQEVWEFVAGRADNQQPENAAKRELLEETGLEADDITTVGDIYIADGITSFKSTICIARNLTKVTDRLGESDGILEVMRVSMDEVIKKILAGEIQCGPSIAAFFMVKAYLEGEKK
jgi:8-oxo-dGTP pyrophosphatase MutT (NUDIX family)